MIAFRSNEKIVLNERNVERGTEGDISKERPVSITPMTLHKTSVSSNENSQEDGSLLELPSPISRHGSLVGDPQLPVPIEFLDVSEFIKT